MSADFGDFLDLIEAAVDAYPGPVHPDTNTAFFAWLEDQRARVGRQTAEDVAYDMAPKPQPGQRVRITYEAVWSYWDSIKRPVTRPIKQPDTSRFLAPRDAFIEIIEEK